MPREPFPIHCSTHRATLGEQLDWLKAQGCTTRDFNIWIGGVREGPQVLYWDFAEHAREHALLLKLTFGGNV